MFNDIDDFYFQGNTSGSATSISEAQPISGKNTRGSHGNIYITDNTFIGFRRMAIELQVPVRTASLPELARRSYRPQRVLQLGPCQDRPLLGGGRHIVCCKGQRLRREQHRLGQKMNGTSGYKQWAIEIATPHTSICQNRVVDTDYPILSARLEA